MPVEITMPQLSDTMTEGTVVKWLKKEGDKVKGGETIAEVETDKAVMEMESFEGGTLAHIAAPEGTKVPVGGLIAVLATSKENPQDVKKQAGSPGRPASAGRESAPAAPSSPAPEKSAAPQPQQPARASHTMVAAARGELHEPEGVGHGATRQQLAPASVATESEENGARLRVSPLARRLAAEKGIDLTQLKGSGPGGRIIQRDVESFTPSAKAAATLPATAKPAKPSPTAAMPVLATRTAVGGKELVALTKMRQTIALRLQQSKQQIPHFYETVDIDVEDLVKLRERVNTSLEKTGVRISVGDFVAKAVATALVQHRTVNSHFDAAKGEVTQFGDVHLGMAVALENGLIVPVLRNINQMGLAEIRVRSLDLVERARAQKLKGDEMTGATFTVSNLGSYGVREFSAIINPPEVGILAIGNAEKRAVVKGDAIVARTMLTVTLSADHRVVDGATAADFLRTLKGLLEEPGMMLV
jgi:pyruvate dehydrogenase E2 component (dihydrolipoamide acetyltransferase)